MVDWVLCKCLDHGGAQLSLSSLASNVLSGNLYYINGILSLFLGAIMKCHIVGRVK